MALFNHSTRELTAKIVYYGPGLCGKTTNLKVLHGRLERAQTGKLLSLSTAQDRTIYFDLLPVELGNIKGYTVRFQLCTVPGQVFYNETRKIVLRGVDGLVFVVDSQWSMLSHNLESFQNLRDNLHDEKISLESLPLVIQYNKRDLPSALSVEALQDSLNFHAYPFVEAVASEGGGVAETFKLISKLTFVDLLRRLQRGGELPAESTAPSDRKTVALPPIPASSPIVSSPATAPAPKAPPAPPPVETDAADDAASWAIPSADGIFADLSEDAPLESSLVTDVPSEKPLEEKPASTLEKQLVETTAPVAELGVGRSLVGARASSSSVPAAETRSSVTSPSIDAIRKEVDQRRSQMTWRPRVSEGGTPLDEKLNGALEEARKAAQRAAARRPTDNEDGSTQEISNTRLRERGEMKKLEDALETARAEARESRKTLEAALEKLRAESAEAKKTLEKAIEDAVAAARARTDEDRSRVDGALSTEKAAREEAAKAHADRVAALEQEMKEEMKKLHTALDEAKGETQTKVDALRSAADEATKKWASALRRTLQEFGE